MYSIWKSACCFLSQTAGLRNRLQNLIYWLLKSMCQLPPPTRKFEIQYAQHTVWVLDVGTCQYNINGKSPLYVFSRRGMYSSIQQICVRLKLNCLHFEPPVLYLTVSCHHSIFNGYTWIFQIYPDTDFTFPRTKYKSRDRPKLKMKLHTYSWSQRCC